MLLVCVYIFRPVNLSINAQVCDSKHVTPSSLLKKNICKLSCTFHYLHFIRCCVTASILSVQQPHNMASRFIVDSEIQLATCVSLSGAAKFIHIPLQLSSSLVLTCHVESARYVNLLAPEFYI
jgi:hypothetical protein